MWVYFKFFGLLTMPELYCEYLVLQNWTFYTGKRQTKDAKTKLNNPRRQKWRQVLSVKVNPQAPAPLHKIWWCHDPLTQRSRKQYLVSLPRNKIMHCKLVKAMNFSNCDYWSLIVLVTNEFIFEFWWLEICWVYSTHFSMQKVCWQCPAMFCL